MTKYMHIHTGSIDTAEGWISSYDPEELAERGVSATDAFDADKGKTLIDHKAVKDYLSEIGSRGRGESKRRGDRAYYQAIRAKRTKYGPRKGKNGNAIMQDNT